MKDTIFIDSIEKVNEIILHNNITLHSEKIKDIPNTIFHMPERLVSILIPATITLLVFIFGQLVSWFRNQKDIQNEINNYKKIILGWAELIKMPIEQQIIQCRDLSLRISNSNDIIPERFSFIKMMADKADSISIDTYISTFMINTTSPKAENGNEKMTFNLVSQYNFLTSIDKNIVDTYKAYQNEINKIVIEWNDKFFNFKQIIDKWTREVVEGHDYFDFRQNVWNISVHWINTAPNGRTTMLHSMNHLITPLSELVNIELTANLNNEYAYQLSETLQYLRVVDLKWRLCNNGFSTVFNEIANNIEVSLNSLIEANMYFSTKTKTKNIFSIGKTK